MTSNEKHLNAEFLHFSLDSIESISIAIVYMTVEHRGEPISIAYVNIGQSVALY